MAEVVHSDGRNHTDSAVSASSNFLRACALSKNLDKAHARRKLDEALKALPPSLKSAPVGARKGLDFCNQLFSIERDLKEVTNQKRYETRLERSQSGLMNNP